MLRLKEIAQIKTGVYAKTDRHGNAIYLQMRHFNENGEIDGLIDPDLFIEDRLKRHFLQEGDVLFAAKGEKNFSAVYHSDIGPAVASSAFFVIKSQKQIVPEYLAWFLSNSRIQKKLKAAAKGSGIPSISIRALGDLEIEIPEISAQRKIIKLDSLRIREKKLLHEIEKLKDLALEDKILSRI